MGNLIRILLQVLSVAALTGLTNLLRCANAQTFWRYLLALAIPAIVAGCAVGPNFGRPEPPAVASYIPEPLVLPAYAGGSGMPEQSFKKDQDSPSQWWTLFKSPSLNILIEQALKKNPTIEAAEAALRVAQENQYAQEGAYFPSVQAGFSPSKQRVAKILSSPLGSGDSIFNLHTAQVSVSYVADVFGGNRRQVESLEALAELQRFQLLAAQLTVTSNVVNAAVQEASLRAQIAATEEIIGIQQEQLDITRHQFRLGSVAEASVIAQEATLAQTQTNLPPLQKQLAQQRSALAVLAGRFPGDPIIGNFVLGSLNLPAELPISLPSRLVDRRPDIRAAEAQMHSASAQVGVAVSNMLPQFTISANGGTIATQIANLLTSENRFWSIAGAITQPIFAGGALLHRKRAAEAAYDQAAAQYRSTVLAAFQNVADTLHALQYDVGAYQAALMSEQASKSILDIVRKQMELGDINYLTVLNADQAYRQAVINRVQAQANRFADTAALFQALGGGW